MASAGILVGAVVAKYYPNDVLLPSGWIAVAAILLILCIWKQRVWCVVLVIFAGLLLGYVRGSNEVVMQKPISSFYNQTVTLQGEIIEDVTHKNGSDRMTLKSLKLNGREMAGKMWVSVRHKDGVELHRSDTITLQGNLEPGFATFSATIMNGEFISGSRITHGDIALEVRDWFSAAVSTVIPNPEIDLGLGFLVGEKNSLPDDLLTALKVTGLTHVVVASGYNLTILVRLSRRLLSKYSKFSALAGSAGLVFSFIMVTGMSPSMSRAGIVTGLSLVAWYYGRKLHPIVLLLVAAAITVCIDPTYAWGDAGWLLSFSAFAGVLIAAPLLNAYFFGDGKPGILRQIILETTSAQILTMPIIIAMFGQFSLIALLANLLILPLIPFVMLITFIAGVGVIMHIPFIGVVGWASEHILQYMIWVVELLASVSWASVSVSISIATAVVLYVIIAAVLWLLHRNTKLRLNDANVVE